MKDQIFGTWNGTIRLDTLCFLLYFYLAAYDIDDETRQDDALFSPSPNTYFLISWSFSPSLGKALSDLRGSCVSCVVEEWDESQSRHLAVSVDLA
jgi:hypothetical protein